MYLLLKFMEGDEQYRFLQKLFEGVFLIKGRQEEVIQKIMDEVNKQ